MPEMFICPRCGQTLSSVVQRCPSCGYDLVKSDSPATTGGTGSLSPGTGPLRTSRGTGPLPRLPGTGPLSEPSSAAHVSPEILVPRLGFYLVEKGIISPEDLQRALDYQQKKADMGHPRLLGRALIELGMLDRETLDQVITSQIASLQSALHEANRQLEVRVQDRTQDLEWRLVLIQTAAEITRQAISATNLDELLERTVNLIVERLNYYLASIYMLDDNASQAVLRAASAAVGKIQIENGHPVSLDFGTTTAWVIQNRQARVSTDISPDLANINAGMPPETLVEAGIPLVITDQVIGVLLVQCTTPEAFAPGELEVLQVIGNHISSVIQNLHLLDQARRNLSETSLLYQASQQIANAEHPTGNF